MTSCGFIIIGGCFYSIKLTYTNTDGTAATLNPDAEQKEQVKAKVKKYHITQVENYLIIHWIIKRPVIN